MGEFIGHAEDVTQSPGGSYVPGRPPSMSAGRGSSPADGKYLLDHRQSRSEQHPTQAERQRPSDAADSDPPEGL